MLHAVLTTGDESIIIRGDSTSTDIPESLIDKIAETHGTFDFHTHPYDGDIRPSPEDMDFMATLHEKTGQETSRIISTDGKFSIYNKYGVVETGTVKTDIGDDYEEALDILFKN